MQSKGNKHLTQWFFFFFARLCRRCKVFNCLPPFRPNILVFFFLLRILYYVCSKYCLFHENYYEISGQLELNYVRFDSSWQVVHNVMCDDWNICFALYEPFTPKCSGILGVISIVWCVCVLVCVRAVRAFEMTTTSSRQSRKQSANPIGGMSLQETKESSHHYLSLEFITMGRGIVMGIFINHPQTSIPYQHEFSINLKNDWEIIDLRDSTLRWWFIWSNHINNTLWLYSEHINT